MESIKCRSFCATVIIQLVNSIIHNCMFVSSAVTTVSSHEGQGRNPVLQESLGGWRDSFMDNGPLWKYVQGTVGEPDHFWGAEFISIAASQEIIKKMTLSLSLV